MSNLTIYIIGLSIWILSGGITYWFMKTRVMKKDILINNFWEMAFLTFFGFGTVVLAMLHLSEKTGFGKKVIFKAKP